MADFTSEDLAAAQTATRYLTGTGLPDDDFYREGFSISDVEDDFAKFSAEVDLLRELEFDVMPALRIGDEGEKVPISLEALPGGPLTRFWFNRDQKVARRILEREFKESRDESRVALISIPNALARFSEKASEFLAARIAGLRELDMELTPPPSLSVLRRRGGNNITAPGCLFTVTTNNLGLRVFWSGAYYINGNYFGHPTFPVRSVLQAGTYVFGVDGGAYGNTIQWDHRKCTLPGSPSVHLNY